jgi:RimJ/RimL family protein N-acetyltransferase
MRFWSMPPWTVRESAAKLIADDAEAAVRGDAIRWGIADPQDRLIGTVSLHRFHATNRRAEIGYILRSDQWGHGYAREAVSLAIDHAFGPLGLHRIEADTDPRNTGSCKLLERLGFKLEGVMRERWIVDGEVSDSACYGLLAREWRRSGVVGL